MYDMCVSLYVKMFMQGICVKVVKPYLGDIVCCYTVLKVFCELWGVSTNCGKGGREGVMLDVRKINLIKRYA